MLTIWTSEEFDAWFQALDDDDAEDVATGVELIEALGPGRAPPASSDRVLWYEDISASAGLDLYGSTHVLHFVRDVHRMLKHLESDAVQLRLREVDEVSGQRVIAAIQRLGVLIRWQDAQSLEAVRRDVDRQYRNVLEVAGLSEPPADPPPEGLRQIDFLRRQPGLRVLYGVDNLASRALLILGERLDRRAYGPSVRRALAQWRTFLGRAELAIRPVAWSQR